MTFDQETLDLTREVLAACRARGVMIATAESCTGGLIAAALTEIAGSSDVVERGFVTYSNEAKMDLLDIRLDTLAAHGAVSEPTARAMAQGAIARSRAGIAVAVTGIAGPGGGTPAKPVGRVHIATARRDGGGRHLRLDLGDIGRGAVRSATVKDALRLVLATLD